MSQVYQFLIFRYILTSIAVFILVVLLLVPLKMKIVRYHCHFNPVYHCSLSTDIARDIAERVPMVLVSTSYRLAPEHPFPAGLEDCIASYKWMKENAAKYSAHPEKAVIMGGSAGGNLSTAVTLSVLDDPKLKPQGLLCACASTIDPEHIPEEYKSFWQPEKLLDSAMLNRKAMKPCFGRFINLQICARSYITSFSY
jgi:acetyl esterase/lipase